MRKTGTGTGHGDSKKFRFRRGDRVNLLQEESGNASPFRTGPRCHSNPEGLERGQRGGLGSFYAARLRRAPPPGAQIHPARARGSPLQATALVHGAYLRMVDEKNMTWKDRAHFYGIAARLMRRILVDHARAHNAVKRGGLEQKFTLDEARDFPAPGPTIWLRSTAPSRISPKPIRARVRWWS